MLSLLLCIWTVPRLGKLHLAAASRPNVSQHASVQISDLQGHRDLAVRFLRRTGLPLGPALARRLEGELVFLVRIFCGRGVLGPAATEADVLERGPGASSFCSGRFRFAHF